MSYSASANPIGLTARVLDFIAKLTTPLFITGETTKSNPQASADAVANVAGGGVESITIIEGGSGYLVAPTVSFSGGNPGSGHVNAQATATITGGVVTAITVTQGGSGYATPPNVILTASPSSVALAGDGTTTAFSGGLQRLPLSPGSVSIKDSGSVETFTDIGGAGILTSTLGGTGTINYQTGAFTLTFNTAPANSTTIVGAYSYGRYSQFQVGRNTVSFGGGNIRVTFVDNFTSLPYEFDCHLQRRDVASGVKS